MNYYISLCSSGHYVVNGSGQKVYPVTGSRTRKECESWIETQQAIEGYPFQDDQRRTEGFDHPDFDECEYLSRSIQAQIQDLEKLQPDHWIVRQFNAALVRGGQQTDNWGEPPAQRDFFGVKLPWFLKKQAD